MSNTQQQAVSGTATVVVGCKLPHGFICELGKFGEDGYKKVELAGANSSKLIGGHGLTTVDEAFWNAWKKKIGDRLVPVKKGFIFADKDSDVTTATAIDRAQERTGFERLDPKKLPKNLKTFNAKD